MTKFKEGNRVKIVSNEFGYRFIKEGDMGEIVKLSETNLRDEPTYWVLVNDKTPAVLVESHLEFLVEDEV